MLSKLNLSKKQILILVAVILLIVLTGFFTYESFLKPNHYLIHNEYYGFRLQTPNSWVAREKVYYSEDNIAKILSECKTGKTDNKIGDFRFVSQKYPEDFGNPGYLPKGISSGIILGITINCNPSDIKTQSSNSVLKVAGENARESFFDYNGFGKIKQVSFLHDNFQYKISEYVYIAPGDKNNEVNLRKKYSAIIDKIISSFNFVK